MQGSWHAALNPLWLLNAALSAEIIDLESNRRDHIEAEYLIGCDGANSMVRRSVDIKISVKTLAHIANLREKADDFFRYVARQRLWSNVQIIDPLGTQVARAPAQEQLLPLSAT